MESLPDLLNFEPTLSLDKVALGEALSFAFATGRSSQAMDDAMASARPGEPRWDPDCFARDLYLDAFMSDCFKIRVGPNQYRVNKTWMTRVLSDPPSDVRTVRFRQEILEELDRVPQQREDFSALFEELNQLRYLFNTTRHGIRADMTHFRVNILHQIKNVTDWMATHFQETTSGLSRLHQAGLAIRKTKAYQDLAGMIDFEGNMARLDVQIRLSADGKLRGMEVLSIDENASNRYYASPLERVWGRAKLWFRGYRFLYEELIGQLIDRVFDQLEQHLIPYFQVLCDMEVYMASLAFADRARAKGLPVCLPGFHQESVQEQHSMKIVDLYNPLLFQQDVDVVPCQLENADGRVITIVTGPNSGGKTRMLQAVGLTQLLAQSGLFVPARSAHLPLVSDLFVSLIEDETVSNTEGRLGMELIRIRRLFERCRKDGMILLDELCSGTNPSEGVEIFTMVLELLKKLGPSAFITTHFLELAEQLSKRQGDLAFRQVGLTHKQEPTYQFLEGVARTSLAHKTAARLGVTWDSLLDLIEKRNGPLTAAEQRTQAKSA